MPRAVPTDQDHPAGRTPLFRISFGKPKSFAGARWIFWLLIVALVLAGESARFGKTYYFSIVVVTVVVLGCCWESHFRAISRSSSSQGEWLYSLLALRAIFNLLSLLGWAIPFSLLLILVPTGQDVSDRVATGEALASIASVREAIGQRAKTGQAQEDLGKDLKITKTKHVTDGFVSPNGTIFLVMQDPFAVAVVIPTLVDRGSGKLEWECKGYPKASFWVRCRGD